MRYLLIILICIVCQVNAQSDRPDVDLSNLKAPSAPAFTILGINPDEISRPKTFKDLEVQLANSFTSNGSLVIPTNIALEFQPYWMGSKKNLTFERFVDNPIKDRLQQNLAISIATAELPGYRDTAVLNKRLGFGARTYLLNGKPTRSQKGIMAISSQWDNRANMTVKLISILRSIQSDDRLMIQMINDSTRFRSYIESKLSGLTASEQEVMKMMLQEVEMEWKNNRLSNKEDVEGFIIEEIDQIRTQQEKQLEKTAARLSASILDREGWFLETAGAFVIDFPTNDINVSYVPKYAFWSTLTHRWVNEKKHSAFESIGMLRYISNDVFVNETSNVDVGVKLAWQKSRFSLLGEWIFRQQSATISTTKDQSTGVTTTVKQSRDDYRLALNINYKLTEQLVLTFTVGKGFEINTEVGNNLLSVIGINYGIGGLSTKSIQ